MIDLGTLGGTFAETFAVNENGQAVGISSTVADDTHAFSWTQAGGMIDLATLGGSSSRAVAINRSGQVVGSSTTANGDEHATSWETEAG